MNRQKRRVAENDYTSLQGQIRVQRAFLLAIILVFTMYAIRFQNLYLKIQEQYQSVVETSRYLQEQYQVMSENCQEILHLNQETSVLIQNVLYTFETWPSVLEEIPSYP